MKYNSIICISTIIAISTLLSCQKDKGNGKYQDYTREAINFTGINVNVPSQVSILKSENYQLGLKIESNIEKHIVTIVKDSILYIEYKNGFSEIDHLPINITINMLWLVDITNNSRSDINIDTLIAPNISSTINGSGNINVNYINTESLQFNLLGHGNFSLDQGKISFKNLDLGGTGLFQAENVQTQISSIKIQGKGDVYTHTTDSMYLRISGSGNVYYKGEPKINIGAIGSGTAIPM